MNLREVIIELSEASGVSGHEEKVSQVITSIFADYVDEIKKDALGNLIMIKKGRNSGGKKIMLAAHMDEIGLMVKDIDDKGFISFTNIGGVDQRTLLCQEVLIHGSEETYGIIGAKPPHLTDASERENALSIEDLVIDTGFSKQALEGKIQIGDVITVKRAVSTLQNGWLAGKALDDRAGVAVLYQCLRLLQDSYHDIDVYCVATVQEEVGTRGATTSAYQINPDIGIAIDVGFGRTPELNRFDTIEMGKGPAITMGPNINPLIFKHLKTVAQENYIDYQVEVAPGSTGTDAWPIQIARSGVATGLLSIPLRYMHTSVETICLSDIEKTGKLLSQFIVSFNTQEVESLLCY
ncbi:peptidase M42 family protein [Alkaliphilus metalliredigens QYMF]|uniref:Peptidase M42 family protein n=1 Tax=Alkaliphilus metalliredigens (strain QYMF) TaxID=293826 RepID=A6TRF6_ALKMQ|nr:M42 family metallopeptidase [Alkaliphilus metalliredigens]ABR48774.1 peptidase M42 family protein [Alkaliphilus metalliredigens QYMF]